LSEFDSELIRPTALTEEQRHIEALCDEERYLELNSDILEKMLYEGVSVVQTSCSRFSFIAVAVSPSCLLQIHSVSSCCNSFALTCTCVLHP